MLLYILVVGVLSGSILFSISSTARNQKKVNSPCFIHRHMHESIVTNCNSGEIFEITTKKTTHFTYQVQPEREQQQKNKKTKIIREKIETRRKEREKADTKKTLRYVSLWRLSCLPYTQYTTVCCCYFFLLLSFLVGVFYSLCSCSRVTSS